MMGSKNNTLAIFSNVNFSPQLIAILQELHNQNVKFRVILIGEPELKIAQEILKLGWNLKLIRERSKFGSILNASAIASEIVMYRPKTVFASGQFATIIGMFCAKMFAVKQRIFIRHHSNLHHEYKMKLGRLVDLASNKLCTDVVAVSRVVARILIEDEKIRPNKVTVIFNGIELSKFQSTTPRQTERLNPDFYDDNPFTIGVLSRLTEWKGVAYTAEAFVRIHREFPKTRLRVVGAFSDSYTEVRNILGSLDPSLYTLEVENSDIPNYFRSIDVFIHVPIGEDYEAFGIVYIEALASKVPCIFTQSGILNELEDPTNFTDIVDYRSSDEIYIALKEILQGVSEPKKPVPNVWLEQFSIDKMTKNYLTLIIGET
jgi:glycosyltransferase involved in cell wall biosynthesis